MASYETPLKLGPLLLKNRIVMASLTRNRNLVPGPLQVEYYTQRAGGGLILTEGTLIEAQGSEWSYARKFREQRYVLILSMLNQSSSWYLYG